MSATTVLLVDADEDSRVICGSLLSHFGYRVLVATGADEGARLAREEAPALLVLEIALPGRDGWALFSELREDERTAAIPVMVVTTFAIEEERKRARAMGAAGWLPKPCSPSELLREVQRLLPREVGPMAG